MLCVIRCGCWKVDHAGIPSAHCCCRTSIGMGSRVQDKRVAALEMDSSSVPCCLCDPWHVVEASEPVEGPENVQEELGTLMHALQAEFTVLYARGPGEMRSCPPALLTAAYSRGYQLRELWGGRDSIPRVLLKSQYKAVYLGAMLWPRLQSLGGLAKCKIGCSGYGLRICVATRFLTCCWFGANTWCCVF